MTVSSNQLLQQERWLWQETWNGAASFVLALQKRTQCRSWRPHLSCALIDILPFFLEAQGGMTYDQARGLCYLAAYWYSPNRLCWLWVCLCTVSIHKPTKNDWMYIMRTENHSSLYLISSKKLWCHDSLIFCNIFNVFYITETISVCCVPLESQTSMYK